MIALRIYRVARGSRAIGSTSIHTPKFVMRILIESGVLYVSVAIAHFVSWWSAISYAIYGLSTIASWLNPLDVRDTNICALLIAVYVGDRDCIQSHSHSRCSKSRSGYTKGGSSVTAYTRHPL
jgi:hypothetical protein